MGVMNNRDQAQELAQEFKEQGIPAPESESMWIKYEDFSVYRRYHKIQFREIPWKVTDSFPDYSTNELWRILPDKIDRWNIRQWKSGDGKTIIEYSWVGNFNDCPVYFIDEDPKTTLTDLLKWALKEHPEAVREHLEGLK